MAVRAVFKISEHALVDFHKDPTDIAPMLFWLAVLGFLLTIFGTPFFVSLAFAGLVYVLYKGCDGGEACAWLVRVCSLTRSCTAAGCTGLLGMRCWCWA
jgi:hypothetical protein